MIDRQSCAAKTFGMCQDFWPTRKVHKSSKMTLMTIMTWVTRLVQFAGARYTLAKECIMKAG